MIEIRPDQLACDYDLSPPPPSSPLKPPAACIQAICSNSMPVLSDNSRELRDRQITQGNVKVDTPEAFEAAKHAASMNRYINLAELLSRYGEIRNIDMIAEIIEIALSSDADIESLDSLWGIIEGGSYEFREEHYFTFAKIAITFKRSVSEIIKKIKDQDHISKIAELAFINYLNKPQSIFRDLSFDLPFTEEQRLKLLRSAIDSSSYFLVSKSFHKFRISDPKTRLELLKILIAKDKNGLSNYIQNFEIKDQNELYQIALIEGKNDPYWLLTYIENYGFDQETLDRLAFEFTSELPLEETASKIIKDSSHLRFFLELIDAANIIKIFRITDPELILKLNETVSKFKSQLLWLILDYSFSILEVDPKTDPDLKEALLFSDPINKLLGNINKIVSMRIPAVFKTEEEEAIFKKELQDASGELRYIAKLFGVSEQIDIWNLIEKRNHLILKKNDLIWFGCLILQAGMQSELKLESPLFDEAAVPILRSIYPIKSRALRRDASHCLISIYSDPSKKAHLKEIMGGKWREKKHLHLISLFALSLGIGREEVERLLSQLEPRVYRDITGPIVEMLCALSKSKNLSIKDKEILLRFLFKSEKRRDRERTDAYQMRLVADRIQQRKEISALHTLLVFDQHEILQKRDANDSLFEIAQEFLRQTFGIKTDDFPEFIETFFQSDRFPNGLNTYVSRLMILPENERNLLMPFIGKFVTSILSKDFPQMRYIPQGNRHLETLVASHPNLLVNWQTPLKLENTDPLDIKGQNPQLQIQKCLRYAIENHHLGADQDEKYPGLNDVLNGSEVEFDDVDSERGSIERNCAIILNPQTDLSDIETALRTLQAKFPHPDVEFHHNLKSMVARLVEPQATKSDWKIEDTDAWEDFLMMGTEVDDSCQHIKDDPANNKCLITYALDGKIRLMVARDPATQKIVGRSVIRLLLDKDTNQPVLFMERLYVKGNINTEVMQQDIIAACLQKAKAMGIPLAANAQHFNEQTERLYPRSLYSLGGLVGPDDTPGPNEYVDALNDQIEGGIYSIEESLLLWTPKI